LDKSLTLGLF